MMELDVFPEELRKQAVEIGQVLKMDMYPSDRFERFRVILRQAQEPPGMRDGGAGWPFGW